jgi:hypothetical protein
MTLATELAAWLDERVPAAPPALRERMDASLAGVTARLDGGIAAALGTAALASLSAAIERCDERAAAIDLLAADALLTYAMEAAAEQGGEAVEAVAQAFGGTRLASLIVDHVAEDV